MKRLITSVGMIVFVAALVAGGTGAFFSDTETSTGNLFTAGSIDLSLGSKTSSTGDVNGAAVTEDLLSDNAGRALFNFTDLKPGDLGTVVFRLQVDSNEAFVCAESDLMTGEENTIVDPEADAGDVTSAAGEGELQNYIQFATFADLDLDGEYDAGVEPINVNQYGGDGNGFTNSEIAGAGVVPVADPSSPNTWLTIGSLTPATEYGAGMLYCFGDFNTTGVGPATEVTGCDGGPIGAYNDAQTDDATGAITFTAVQTRNNGDFSCSAQNVDEREPVGAVLGAYVAPTAPDCSFLVENNESIQADLDVAATDNTICVADSYTGVGDNTAIRIEGMGITLAALTQGTALDVPVVLSGNGVTVTGFTGFIGQAEGPAEVAAFYLDNDATNAVVSHNSVSGVGVGAAILTESGADNSGSMIANNVLTGALQGIYLNPHTGTIIIEDNDFSENVVGIAGLNGATVRFNEFTHTTPASEAIGIDSSFDGNVATVNFNNFLDGVMLNDYGATPVVDAENNFFSGGGITQTTAPADFDFDPEEGSAFPHN